MSREIEFRGFDIVSNNKVYGGYFQHTPDEEGIRYYIFDINKGAIEVIFGTISQFTGFKVRKKKRTVEDKIYEDDIFRFTDDDRGDFYKVVMWLSSFGMYCMVPIEQYETFRDNPDIVNSVEFNYMFDDMQVYEFFDDIEVGLKVGNIHDNQELLDIE